MHEWGLAQAIINTALSAARKNKLARIDKIIVLLGELEQIPKNDLIFILKQLLVSRKETTGKTRISIKEEQAAFKCKRCARKWTLKYFKKIFRKEIFESLHHAPEILRVYGKCPRCSSHDFNITKGKGIWLMSIEGVKQ
ncbi:hydrogenase nickel incorporation protein HypA [Elusimicrobiota bacterium]